MDRRKTADKGRLSFPPRNTSPKRQPSTASPSSTALRWTPVRKAANDEDEDMSSRTSSLSPREENTKKQIDVRKRLPSESSNDSMKDVNETGFDPSPPKPRTLQEETARAVALSTLRIQSTSALRVQEGGDGDPSLPASSLVSPSPSLLLEPSSNAAKRRARRNAKARAGASNVVQDTPPPPPPQPPSPPLEEEGARRVYRTCLVHKQRRLIQHCVGHGESPIFMQT